MEKAPDIRNPNDRNYDIGLGYLQELRNTIWSLLNKKGRYTKSELEHISYLQLQVKELGRLFTFLKEQDKKRLKGGNENR